MCGIAGIIMLDGGSPDRRQLEAMTRAVAHRGPDGEGIHVEGSVGFGHRRLAIVDLSADGHQPMQTADGKLRITFNGEIYNYIELREELRALGRSFRTKTDTEVILESWRQWGPRCVDRFNGMWGFAIHDAANGTVFLSRDRFGVKPLYLVRTDRALAFGSEIRQFLPILGRVRADRETLEGFLFAGIDEPTRRTFFEGVLKLPPGHSITVSLAEGTVTERREYSISDRAALHLATAEQAADEYGARLDEAVTIRLRADVPVGTCLSGGLDSSAIAAIASKRYQAARGERFRAITAVSEESSNDESPFARAVAERSQLDWITVRPTASDFTSCIEDVVRTQEEPFGGPSVLMQWFVMRAARQAGIPVMLDGQGGDETLLGYRRYFAAMMLDRLTNQGAVAMIRELFACQRHDAQLRTLKIITSMAIQGLPSMSYLRLRFLGRWMRRCPPMSDVIRAEARAMRDVRALQRFDIEQANLPALLRYEDKNSMRFSIETRLPFLDWRSVETALALPTEAKLREGWTKWPLRRCTEELLPPEITWRKWKIGFEAPTSTWLTAGEASMKEAVLGSALLRELGRTRWLERNYTAMHGATRWRLYSVAMWEREFGAT